MGEPENLHFHDFGTFGRVFSSQSQYYIWDTRTFKNNPRKSKLVFVVGMFIFINVEVLETVLKLLEITNTEIMKICIEQSCQSWIRDQHLPENMKWTFGNMGSLNLWNSETSKIWNQETLKSSNQQTSKPRNCENEQLWNQEPINVETKKFGNQETKKRAKNKKPENEKPINQETKKPRHR